MRIVDIKPNQFKRVLSNIFSNIVKYASRDDKVNIIVCDNTITIENLIDNKQEDTNASMETNYIGQNVCSDIMKDMGGSIYPLDKRRAVLLQDSVEDEMRVIYELKAGNTL